MGKAGAFWVVYAVIKFEAGGEVDVVEYVEETVGRNEEVCGATQEMERVNVEGIDLEVGKDRGRNSNDRDVDEVFVLESE